MSLPDISRSFVWRERWRAGNYEYEELSGHLGVPGTVKTHRLLSAQKAMSANTGEHAGHRIGIQFGAPGDRRNLSLQNPNMNTYAPRDLQVVFQGPGGNYLRLESEWTSRLKAGYKIWVCVRDKYRLDEGRPISRRVEWRETDPKGVRLAPRVLEFGNFGSPQMRAAAGNTNL
jgi:hypothetical protein